jgi:cholesterol transport system auxiliary component
MSRLLTTSSCVFIALLLSSCSSLIGGPKQSSSIYAPAPTTQPDAAWPQVGWSLEVAPPQVPRMLESNRIVVSPTPGELQVYRAATWARAPGGMVEDIILRTLEDSGKIASVTRQDSGVTSDYRLLLDLRDFKADYAGQATPFARIEVNAKLLKLSDLSLVESRTFVFEQPAQGSEVAQVSATFTPLLTQLGRDVSAWVLQTGPARTQKAR